MRRWKKPPRNRRFCRTRDLVLAVLTLYMMPPLIGLVDSAAQSASSPSVVRSCTAYQVDLDDFTLREKSPSESIVSHRKTIQAEFERWIKTQECVQNAEGVYFRILSVSDQKQMPEASENISVHLDMRVASGDVAFSTYEQNQPFFAPVSSLVQGLQRVLPSMRLGERWEVFVPAELGYGQSAQPVGPAQWLIYDVSLVGLPDRGLQASVPELITRPSSEEDFEVETNLVEITNGNPLTIIAALTSGKRIAMDTPNSYTLAGMGAFVLSECSDSLTLDGALRVNRFVEATLLSIQTNLQNVFTENAVGKNMRRYQYVEEGFEAAEAAGCGSIAGVSLASGLVRNLIETDENSNFVLTCQERHSASKCSCLTTYARAASPGVDEFSYLPERMKGVINRNPYLGARIVFADCGLSAY